MRVTPVPNERLRLHRQLEEVGRNPVMKTTVLLAVRCAGILEVRVCVCGCDVMYQWYQVPGTGMDSFGGLCEEKDG